MCSTHCVRAQHEILLKMICFVRFLLPSGRAPWPTTKRKTNCSRSIQCLARWWVSGLINLLYLLVQQSWISLHRIIAVNYPARAKGVTRHMRGDEAKEQCPDIELVKVPNIREKADLSKYRNAGKQVATVLQTYTPLLTRASVDEAYLDLTEQVQNRLLDMNKVINAFSFYSSHLYQAISQHDLNRCELDH